MHKRPLAVIAVFFILGIVLARFLPDWVGFTHIFIATLIFIAASFAVQCRRKKEIASVAPSARPRNDSTKNILLLLSVTSFAALLYLNSNTFPNNHISHVLGEEKLKTDIVGIIKSPALTRKPYYGKISSTYVFGLEAMLVNGEWFTVNGLSQIRIQTEKDYGYGDRLVVKGTIRRPGRAVIARPEGPKQSHKREIASSFDKGSGRSPEYSRGASSFDYAQDETLSFCRRASSPLDKLGTPRNDRGWKRKDFNYRGYLERQNIFALINTKENNVTVLAHDYKSNLVLKHTYLIREKLKNQILEKMPLESGSFLRAILLGDRSELPKHIQTAFKNSGTMHILAISGLHVGLIAVVILYSLRFLRIKREAAYAFTILFLLFFAVLTLLRPSVVRAVLMACLFLIGMLLGRKVDVYNSLGAAAIFILIKNPKDLCNVGFQLSFLAVLSIVYLVPKFMKLTSQDTNFYIRRYLYTPLAVSIAAWGGTFPLILHYFRIITPVAVISNLFILPALFILIIGGLGFLLLGWLPFIGTFLACFNNVFANIIFTLADFFASLRFGHFLLK